MNRFTITPDRQNVEGEGAEADEGAKEEKERELHRLAREDVALLWRIFSGGDARFTVDALDREVAFDGLTGLAKRSLAVERITTKMVVPVLIEDRIEGLLYVDNRSARPFTASAPRSTVFHSTIAEYRPTTLAASRSPPPGRA